MEKSPSLLDTFVASLRRQNLDEETLKKVSVLVEIWIDTLKDNPGRLSSNELMLVAMKRAEDLLRSHMDLLWAIFIDPDQGFSHFDRDMLPKLL